MTGDSFVKTLAKHFIIGVDFIPSENLLGGRRIQSEGQYGYEVERPGEVSPASRRAQV